MIVLVFRGKKICVPVNEMSSAQFWNTISGIISVLLSDVTINAL